MKGDTGSASQSTQHAVEGVPLVQVEGSCHKPQAEDDTRCGMGPFHPAWLQKFASKKSYVFLHGLMGLNLFALYSYNVAIVSTLEKRFKIPSRTSGIIMTGLDIGIALSSIGMGYASTHFRMPRLIALGALFTSLACFVGVLPHIIYGPGQDALELTEEFGDGQMLLNITEGKQSLCGAVILDEEDCYDGIGTSMPVILFFITKFLLGIGDSGQIMLGLSFLDSNSRKNKAPLLMAISACLGLLGPSIGFSVASYTLSQYVEPSLHPTIGPEDPRWIGAWWMGWAPNGIVACILALLMALFPRQLPRAKQRKALTMKRTSTPRKISFKDFGEAVKRLLQNRVFFLNTMSTVFFMFGFTGYWIFMPKYMETQYGQSAASASFISGSIGLVFTGLGIATSAIVISKFKPSARYLAAWSAFVEFLEVIVHFSWTFLGCETHQTHGHLAADGSWNLTMTCNANCSCGGDLKYNPICSADESTSFFSPCHAGCSSYDIVNQTKMYINCSCISGGNAVEGMCPTDCSTIFTIFLATQCAVRFLEASGKAGNTLIHFRCVDEGDKAFSIGVTECVTCILTFIPAPIVYGILLDSACIVWGQSCGHTGNCWLYDGPKLRYLVNFTATALLTAGALFDMGVWYYCKDLKIYDEEGDSNEDKPKEKTSCLRYFISD